MDIVKALRSIADAARRDDGSDIPLGETCREAANEIESLREDVVRHQAVLANLHKLSTSDKG